jgi:hypothetical protein
MLGAMWGAFAVAPLGDPLPNLPGGFEVVSMPGVGVGVVLLPMPGDTPPALGVVAPIPGDMPPALPPVPGEGGPPPVPCASAEQALPAKNVAARRTANLIMIARMCILALLTGYSTVRLAPSTEFASQLGY